MYSVLYLIVGGVNKYYWLYVQKYVQYMYNKSFHLPKKMSWSRPKVSAPAPDQI